MVVVVVVVVCLFHMESLDCTSHKVHVVLVCKTATRQVQGMLKTTELKLVISTEPGPLQHEAIKSQCMMVVLHYVIGIVVVQTPDGPFQTTTCHKSS